MYGLFSPNAVADRFHDFRVIGEPFLRTVSYQSEKASGLCRNEGYGGLSLPSIIVNDRSTVSSPLIFIGIFRERRRLDYCAVLPQYLQALVDGAVKIDRFKRFGVDVKRAHFRDAALGAGECIDGLERIRNRNDQSGSLRRKGECMRESAGGK